MIKYSFPFVEFGALLLCADAFWSQIGYYGAGINDHTEQMIGKPVSAFGWFWFIILFIAVVLLCGRRIIITPEQLKVQYCFGLISRIHQWKEFQYNGVWDFDEKDGRPDGSGIVIYLSCHGMPKHWWTVLFRTIWMPYTPSLWSVVKQLEVGSAQKAPDNIEKNDISFYSGDDVEPIAYQKYEQIRFGIAVLYFVCAICLMLTEKLYVLLPLGIMTFSAIVYDVLILRKKEKTELEKCCQEFLKNISNI